MADAIVPDAVIRADNFIKKSERNATPANDDGRVPQLEDDGYLHGEFIKNVLSFKTRETFDGTTTPVAVQLAADGYLQRADANVIGLQGFFGFCRQSVTGKEATFLSGQQQTTSTSFSHTLDTGTDRLILIVINMALVGTTVTASSVTWNGNACTKLLSDHGSRAGIDVWYYKAGTGSSATGNVVITGATGQASVFVTNWGYVDQTNPFQASQIANAVSGLSITTSLTTTQSSAVIVQGHCDRNGNAVTTDSLLTLRYTEGTSRKQADGMVYGIRTISLTSSTSITSYTATDRGVGFSLALKSSTTSDATAEVWHEGIVQGFSGLTAGSEYFVSDTVGSFATTPGTRHLKIGLAVSTSAIFLQKQKRIAAGITSFASSTDQPIYLGFRPRIVRVWAVADGGAVTNHSLGSWVEGQTAGYVESGDDNASGETVGSSTGAVWQTTRLAGGALFSSGVISNVTSSGFTLDVTYASGTTLIYWEAEE